MKNKKASFSPERKELVAKAVEALKKSDFNLYDSIIGGSSIPYANTTMYANSTFNNRMS